MIGVYTLGMMFALPQESMGHNPDTVVTNAAGSRPVIILVFDLPFMNLPILSVQRDNAHSHSISLQN